MKASPPNTVTVIILTTITVVFWVFFSVYRILTTTATPPVTDEILAPIDPNLDTTTLDSLETKIYFQDENLVNTIIVSPSPAEENASIDEIEALVDSDFITESQEGQAEGITPTPLP